MAVVARAGDDQAIEFHEMRRSGERLASFVCEALVSGRVDAEGAQRRDISKAKRSSRLNANIVQLMVNAARPDRFQAKAKADLGERAIAFEAGVQYLHDPAWAPSTWRC
jgi:hypothetical protein